MDTRGLENEICGRHDEKLGLFSGSGKEAMEMHGNTFQNVRKGIAKKETHTAVL